MSEIDDRMNDIETLLCDTERRLDLSHASHAFYTDLSALQHQLEEYEAWLDRDVAEEEGSDYVEAVTQQMRSMKALDEGIKALSNRIAEFQCQDWPELTHQVEEDFSGFNSRWLRVFDRYSECRVPLFVVFVSESGTSRVFSPHLQWPDLRRRRRRLRSGLGPANCRPCVLGSTMRTA